MNEEQMLGMTTGDIPIAAISSYFCNMKIHKISLVLVFVLSSCAKYMDDQHPGTDSSATRDSAVMETIKTMPKEKLSGVWVKPIKTEPGDEGFNLKADGSLAFVNIYSMTGDKWELHGDSLILFSHTERYPAPAPHAYKIRAVTDSTITLIPANADSGYTETYRRKAFTVPERFKEFFMKEFIGIIEPTQTMQHRFVVKSIFDGQVTLSASNDNIRFILMKDGDEVSSPVKVWTGSFPPGHYTIKVLIISGKMEPGSTYPYRVPYKLRVEEY
jgi:hypothetical protein